MATLTKKEPTLNWNGYEIGDKVEVAFPGYCLQDSTRFPIPDECFKYNFYNICTDGVQLINGEIYELIEHNEFDECEDLDFFHILEDGSILFVTEFHNGGTCLEEVLDSGVTRISKNQ